MVRGSVRQARWGGCVLLLAALAALASCKGAGALAAPSQAGPSAPAALAPTQVAVYAGVGNSLRVYGMSAQTGELST